MKASDIESMSDERLANFATTLVYIMLGQRALEVLVREGWEFMKREKAQAKKTLAE